MVVSKKPIGSYLPGFWKSYKHVQNQFVYLTNCPGLIENIKHNLVDKMKLLERYLEVVHDKKKEFEEIFKTCEIQFDGALVYKYVHVLRLVGSFLDSDGSVFMMIEEDGASRTPAPHIKAVQVAKNFVFQVYVDKNKVLSNLTLAEALGSFLHIAFVFGLESPKVAFKC